MSFHFSLNWRSKSLTNRYVISIWENAMLQLHICRFVQVTYINCAYEFLQKYFHGHLCIIVWRILTYIETRSRYRKSVGRFLCMWYTLHSINCVFMPYITQSKLTKYCAIWARWFFAHRYWSSMKFKSKLKNWSMLPLIWFINWRLAQFNLCYQLYNSWLCYVCVFWM